MKSVVKHSCFTMVHTAIACCAMAALSSCGLRLPIERHEVVLKPNTTSPRESSQQDAPSLVPVYLISDRYHTGMVFSYPWLCDHGFVAPEEFPTNTRFVCMSWGNEDAYSTRGLDSPWKWFRVLLTPTPSVMEMIPCNWNVPEVLPDQQIWMKMVEQERGSGLAHFLNECTKDDNASGTPIVVTRSSWGNGVQLASDASYFIPRVCNVWTAQAVESMGYHINPWRGITASALIAQLEGPPHHFAQIWPGGGKPAVAP